MSRGFEHDWTVRFSDADMHGIAHYPRIVDAVHETSDAFVAAIGWPFWRTHDEAGFGLPIVEANFEFDEPLHAGDEVTIRLVPDLGDRSVRFDYEARRDGETVFTASEQRVCAAVGAESAMALPEGLREAMAPYADG